MSSHHSDSSVHSTPSLRSFDQSSSRRESLKRGREPVLDDMVEMLRPDKVLARPPITKFLKYGIDNPVFDGTRSPSTSSPAITYAKPSATLLKEELRAFLLPSKAKRTAALLQEQGGSPSLYMTPTTATQYKWVINPTGSFRILWDGCVLLLVAVNMFLIPLDVAYFSNIEEEPIQWTVFNLASDVIFLVDIVFNFRTGVFVDDCYQLVNMDPSFIAWKYVQGWFFLDLVSSLPLDYILAYMLITNRVYVVRLLHLSKFLALLKLFRISRLVRYLIHVEENYFFYSRGVYIRMGNTMGILLMIAHWNACLQFFVPRMQGFPTDSWPADLNIQNGTWFQKYSWSMFNALSQMLCAGYGGSTPRNLTDMWLTCLGISSGAIGYALLLGHVANMIQAMDHTKSLHREKMKELEDYMNYQNFPKRLRRRIRDYFENRYHGRVFDENAVLSALSDPLREEVLRHNCRSLVRSVPFFANGDPEFVADLVARMKHEFFLPGDVIVKQGSLGTKMYFVQSGKVNIILDDGDMLGTISEGSYFGEMCLLRRTKRQANAVAATYCNTFTLSAEGFRDLLSKYPAIRRAVDEIIAECLPEQRSSSPS